MCEKYIDSKELTSVMSDSKELTVSLSDFSEKLTSMMSDSKELFETKKQICLVCGRHCQEGEHMYMILPGLYVGGIWTAHSEYQLRHFKISHIINVAKEGQNKFPNTIIYRKLNWDDNEHQNIIQDLDQIVDFIHVRLNPKDPKVIQGNVLVHCIMGRSRSISVIIAYLIKYKNMTFDEALNYVSRIKYDANPNEGFRIQLRQYAK